MLERDVGPPVEELPDQGGDQSRRARDDPQVELPATLGLPDGEPDPEEQDRRPDPGEPLAGREAAARLGQSVGVVLHEDRGEVVPPVTELRRGMLDPADVLELPPAGHDGGPVGLARLGEVREQPHPLLVPLPLEPHPQGPLHQRQRHGDHGDHQPTPRELAHPPTIPRPEPVAKRASTSPYADEPHRT